MIKYPYKSRNSIIAAAVLGTTILLLGSAAEANATGIGLLAPKDANLTPQQEAAANALWLLGTLEGPSNRPIPWSGTITDSGWTYQISAAPYRDGVLNMSYVGLFDPVADVVSWTGHTSFLSSQSALTWTAIGTYSDASIDGFWSELWQDVQITTLVVGTAVADVAVGGFQAVGTLESGGSTGAELIDSSDVFVTGLSESGEELVEKILKDDQGNVSTSVHPVNLESVRLEGVLGPLQPVTVNSFGQISGTSSTAYVISGDATVSPVPEPATISLVIAGTIGWICARLRRN